MKAGKLKDISALSGQQCAPAAQFVLQHYFTEAGSTALACTVCFKKALQGHCGCILLSKPAACAASD